MMEPTRGSRKQKRYHIHRPAPIYEPNAHKLGKRLTAEEKRENRKAREKNLRKLRRQQRMEER